MKTIVLTGGGTAGHCLPNIALLPYLKKYFDNIVYIGGDGIEKTIATEHNLTYYQIPTVKLQRKFTFKNFAVPFKLLKNIITTKKLLKSISPSVIFSKGGYVSLPVILAGNSLSIPCVTHESDLTIGLSNKIMAKKCEYVFTSFESTAKALPNGVFVGSPIRNSLFYQDKQSALKRFNLSGNKPVILVTGGSSGSLAINLALDKALDKLLEKYDIIHLCGKGKQKRPSKTGYTCLEYLNQMEMAFCASDVVVTRGGSNALFELIALSKPMLVIPLPKDNSRGDQIQNAKYFEERGLCKVLLQENLTSNSLIFNLNELYSHKQKYINALATYPMKKANYEISSLLNKISK